MLTLILPMYLGVPVILLTEISSASLLKTLQENVVTVILGVPRVWEMLDKAIMAKINESSLARFMFKIGFKNQFYVYKKNDCSQKFINNLVDILDLWYQVEQKLIKTY